MTPPAMPASRAASRRKSSASLLQIFLSIVVGVLMRPILTSANVQKKFGSDKHRTPIGVTSDLDRTFAKKFDKLTKNDVGHNNKV